MEIVVAGGGVAGLATALILARAGHRAILLERDPLDCDGGWQAAFNWPRAGIPHFHQPHAFQPRGRKVLRDALPDVYDDLLAAGAFEHEVWRKAPAGAPFEDPDLVYLCVRREVIEWALRKAVLTEPNITVHSQTQVAGLFGDEGPVPHIRGVLTSTGERIGGDLVVDAMGRRSPVASWLPALGGRPPEVNSSECYAVYYSRYFQIRPGNRFPDGPWLAFPLGDLGYARFSTFIGDNLTFAIVLMVPTWDRELRQLRREEAYMAACRSIPLMQPLVNPQFADPITPVLPMGSLQNMVRDYFPGGEAVAAGIVPVGDAYCHSDPTFALGVSMSVIHAVELARSIAAHPGAPATAAAAYFTSTLPEVAERYALARDTDNARMRVWQGEKLDATKRTGSYPLFMVVAASTVATRDPEVFLKVMRRVGLLDSTAVFDNNIQLQERVERRFAEMIAASPPPPTGPTRDALLAQIASAPTRL